MADRKPVTVPDIGDYSDVPVIEVLVADGDRVEKDQSLVVLESDKATMDVPAPEAGIVRDLKVKEGDSLSQGDAICELEALEAEGVDEGAGPGTGDDTGPGTRDQGTDSADDAETGNGKRETARASAQETGNGQRETAADADAESTDDGDAASEQSTTTRAVTVPDIGDYSDVPVIEVLVADGDTVEKDQSLVVLESDKATMDVPAPAAGTVRGLKVKEGDSLSQGDAICELEVSGAGKDSGPGTGGDTAPETGDRGPSASAAASAETGNGQRETASASSQSRPAVESPPPEPKLADGELPPHASPSVRKFARHLGVDLRKVAGSGPKDRILREDVEAYVSRIMKAGTGSAAPAAGGGFTLPAQPDIDFSQFGEVETRELARIRKLSAKHLHRNWLLVPHVTQTDEADITDLEAFRKSRNAEGVGPKLTMLPFVIKAVGLALKAWPEFNASLAADGEHLVVKKYCHVGFAADTPNGLVVPVIRDIWHKGIGELAEECGELAAKARDGKLKPDEMKGGCFSISSLGGIGGSHFTPIVNAPEVGILGVSRAAMKPVWDGKEFQPRLMCPLSLSYDHRVIDGAYAARFIVELVRLLSDIRRLSL